AADTAPLLPHRGVTFCLCPAPDSQRIEHVSALPAATAPKARPRLRGVLHQYAFLASLITGPILLSHAPSGKALIAVAVYAASLSALLGVSALYHRVTWTPSARWWMGRLDHAMIYVLIAGTYTPVGLLTLTGKLAIVLLVVMYA